MKSLVKKQKSKSENAPSESISTLEHPCTLQKFRSKTNTCFVYPLHLFRSQIRVCDFAVLGFQDPTLKNSRVSKKVEDGTNLRILFEVNDCTPERKADALAFRI